MRSINKYQRVSQVLIWFTSDILSLTKLLRVYRRPDKICTLSLEVLAIVNQY